VKRDYIISVLENLEIVKMLGWKDGRMEGAHPSIQIPTHKEEILEGE